MDSRVAAVAALVLALASGPTATAQEVHQDTRLGFKLRPPKDFSQVPLKPDEEWIAARWISDKAYYQTDKSDGWTHDHKPEMFVVAFAKGKPTTERVEVDHKENEDGSGVSVGVIKQRYRDYKSYLKQTYQEGGFYIAAEEKLDLEGIPVTTLDIKVERGLFGGPRKIFTWIYQCDDAEFAVQFEMFEAAWVKVKSDVLSSLRSFRRIAKDASKAADQRDGGIGAVIKETRLDELSPAQRAGRRRELAKEAQAKAAKDLPEGWWAKKLDRVFVLSHIEEKYAAKFASDASAVLDYLDSNLGFIGPGEYVREPILRLCKDFDEYRMYDKGGTVWTRGQEIVSYRNTGYLGHFSNNFVNQRIAQHWIEERNEDLFTAMPAWFRYGLLECFSMSREEKGKLEFFNDSWERVDVAQQIRDGKFSTLKELMHLDGGSIYGVDSNKHSECAAAVRYLLSGPKKAKDALRAYLDALAPIAKKNAEDRKNAHVATSTAKKAKTEEEEDAAFREARTKERDKDKKLLGEIFQRAFGGYGEAEWKSLETAYTKSLG